MFKKIFLFLIILTLLLPIFQEIFGVFTIRPLAGYHPSFTKEVFTKNGWFSRTYQETQEKFIDNNYGLRNNLVRLNNQIDYWFFNRIHAEGIVLGKKGVLYESIYINSHLGVDFIGENKIKETTDKLLCVQKMLESKNIMLLVVLAPSKATYFHECFPKQFNTQKKISNYDSYKEKLKENGINHIDFNSYFLQNRGKTKYPLFTELGIHWTQYGSMLAFDSIVSTVEKKKNLKMPELITNGYTESDTLWPPDGDIFSTTNMLFEMKHLRAGYPIIDIKDDSTKIKPRILTIGDSFWWNIFNSNFCNTVFSNGRFWYYNKNEYYQKQEKKLDNTKKELEEVLKKTDVIVLCYTSPNLNKLGDGIIESLYSLTDNNSSLSAIKTERINKFISFIKEDSNWLTELKKKSASTKIPLDTLIYNDAKWQVEVNGK